MPTPNISYSSSSVEADGVSSIVVTGVPLGSDVTVRFDQASDTLLSFSGIEDTELLLTFSEPGPYEVEIHIKDVTTDEGKTYGHYTIITPVEAT